MSKEFAVTIDVRQFSPKDKHPIIFETFDHLKLGTQMEIINDHNPKPLYYQFKAERNDLFEWNVLEEGPEVWRVSIRKIGVI